MPNLHPNHIAANERQRALKEAELEAKRKSARDRDAFWCVVIILGLGLGAYTLYTENQKDNAYADAVATKWSNWVAYRDVNCKPVEQMFGLVVGQGKFQSIDNATVYECNSGMRYLISKNAEASILAKRGKLEFIPDVPPAK